MAALCLVSSASAAGAKADAGSKLPMVAVMPLSGGSVDEATSAVVTDALADELMKTGELRVMERTQMEKILKEQGFQQSGACDGSECAVEVGRLLSINRMVVGTMGKLGASWTISVRAVDVGTGEILGSARHQERGEIDVVVQDMMPILAQELVASLLGRALPPRPVARAAPVAPQPVVSTTPSGMVAIPAGCFMMGSPGEEGSNDEHPQHRVCVSAFSMDVTEVTQSAYQSVTGKNPSNFDKCGGNCPVEHVNWQEASDYCHRIGKRLPTEAEWEYAARAGTTTKWYWGDNEQMSVLYAWFADNSDGRTHPVAQLRPNAWGLYDMAGNVWEWTADLYGADYYRQSPSQDPQGPSSGSRRVDRGGGWRGDSPTNLRSAGRDDLSSGARRDPLGFRCASR